MVFGYRTVTFYGRSFQNAFPNHRLVNSLDGESPVLRGPATPVLQRRYAYIRRVWALPFSLTATGGMRCLFFSSGYLDVSVPPVSLPYAYVFSAGFPGMTLGGLPHSDIFGSKPVCDSPKLFAACHVLHRLSVPRHPSYALTSLKSLSRALSHDIHTTRAFRLALACRVPIFSIRILLPDFQRAGKLLRPPWAVTSHTLPLARRTTRLRLPPVMSTPFIRGCPARRRAPQLGRSGESRLVSAPSSRARHSITIHPLVQEKFSLRKFFFSASSKATELPRFSRFMHRSRRSPRVT